MRRGLPLSLLATLAVAGCGAGASTSPAGRDTAAVRPAATATPAAAQESKLPPLPAMRPKVVEPEAGSSGGAPRADAASPTDPGLNDAGPAPTAPATSGAREGVPEPGGGSVDRATALPNGIAVPPLEAPDSIKRMIEAGNVIARSPYVWGGGHGRWIDKGYDCSGSVSFVLAAAGYLQGPLDSGHLAQWGEPGPGRWVTIYANAGHVFMQVAGIRFDTSGQRINGSRWQNDMRPYGGFAVRHPPGL